MLLVKPLDVSETSVVKSVGVVEELMVPDWEGAEEISIESLDVVAVWAFASKEDNLGSFEIELPPVSDDSRDSDNV